MDDLKQEETFFRDICSQVIELVARSKASMVVAEQKGAGDYSTHVDIAVEDLIVNEIKKRFPTDHILAEESHSDVAIGDSRIWIIDPICGTFNLGKGLKNFCTNIALADKNKLIAACVVDHSYNEYIWSTGGNKVYVNDSLYLPVKEEFGINIDVDFGAVRNIDEASRQKHNRSLLKLIDETDFDIISLNTSLGFAYTAIGKVDGFITLFNHPWDICAASFLLQQVDGVITTPEGEPWTLTSVGAIGARTPELHKKLLDIF
jgi:myo-inositol-1(or 4)-monophosphatase